MKDYRDGLEMLCMLTCFGVGGWVGGWWDDTNVVLYV